MKADELNERAAQDPRADEDDDEDDPAEHEPGPGFVGGVFDSESPDTPAFTNELLRRCSLGGMEWDADLYRIVNAGEFIYDAIEERCYWFNGVRWVEDLEFRRETVAVEKLLKQYRRAEAEYRKAEKKKEAKSIRKRILALENGGYRGRLVEQARKGPKGFTGVGINWDGIPHLMVTTEGVIDLRTGELRSGHPEDYCRLCTGVPYDKDAPRPERWVGFLEEIFGYAEPPPEKTDDLPEEQYALLLENYQRRARLYTSLMVGFMKRLLGSFLWGQDLEQKFYIFYGRGRNGKSVLVRVILHILGQYAGPISPYLLLDSKMGRSSGSPSPDIVDLRGKRFVHSAETNEGAVIDNAIVKSLTGADTLKGRPLHSNNFVEFEPTHKLAMSTNSKPLTKAEDYALWQRIFLIPFLMSFVDDPDPKKPWEKKKDPDLYEALIEEGPGILKWLVEGCLEWQRLGLNPPDNIRAETQEYRKEVDTIGNYLDQCCDFGLEHSGKASHLYWRYKEWAKAKGYHAFSEKSFKKQMEGRDGITWKKESAANMYYGVELNTSRLKDACPDLVDIP